MKYVASFIIGLKAWLCSAENLFYEMWVFIYDCTVIFSIISEWIQVCVVVVSNDDVIFKDGVLYMHKPILGKRRNFGVLKQSIWFPHWDSVWSSVTFSNPNHILCMSTAGPLRDETRGFLLIQAVCVCVRRGRVSHCAIVSRAETAEDCSVFAEKSTRGPTWRCRLCVTVKWPRSVVTSPDHAADIRVNQ